MKPLTQGELLRRFVYDEATGFFIRRIRLGQKCKAGTRAGTLKPDGYRTIEIDGHPYYEHRLVWLYAYGAWPREELDHIDGNRANNSLENLRECSRAENSQNVVRQTRNPSGFKGVFRRPNSWVARIRLNGKLETIGIFINPADAALAYDEVALHEFGSFAKTNAQMGLLP